MNPASEKEFDQQARQLHSAALSHLSTQTLTRLRTARHAATAAARQTPASLHRFTWPWLLGSAAVLTLTIAIGARFMQPAALPETVTAAEVAPMDVDVADGGDLARSLDEDPGFYLWLASNDSSLL